MGREVTLTLPEDVLERAETVARKRGCPVPDILIESIEMALDPSAEAFSEDDSLQWTDEEVLAAADSFISGEYAERLEALLERQREQRLTAAEKAELTALMNMYHGAQLRKSRGMAEAVRRKLRPPLSS